MAHMGWVMVDKGKKLSNMLRTEEFELLGKTAIFSLSVSWLNCSTSIVGFLAIGGTQGFLGGMICGGFLESLPSITLHLINSAAHTWEHSRIFSEHFSRLSDSSSLRLEKDTITFITPSKQIARTVTSGITGTHPSGGLKASSSA